MSSSLISIHNLRFRYPRALHDTLYIPALEISGNGLIALVGPSGAGKSTFIELIAGTLREPYEGSLQVLGTELQDLKKDADRQQHVRRIGFIPQDFGLLPGKTVVETMKQDLIDANISKDGHALRIAKALAQVALQDYGDRLIEHLSGGQRQRIAIARMLARDVDIVIADEPTANLDPNLVEGTLSLFRQLAHDVPVVIVTHDGHVAEQCQRTIILQAVSHTSELNKIDPQNYQSKPIAKLIRSPIMIAGLIGTLLIATIGSVVFAYEHNTTQAQTSRLKVAQTSSKLTSQMLTTTAISSNQVLNPTQTQGSQLGLKSHDFMTFVQAFAVALQSHDISDIESATDTENFISVTWNAGGGFGSWADMKSGLQTNQTVLDVSLPITTAATLGYAQCRQYTSQGIGALGINFDDGNTTQYIVGSRSYYEGYMYTGLPQDVVFAFEQATNGTWLWRAVTVNNAAPASGLC